MRLALCFASIALLIPAKTFAAGPDLIPDISDLSVETNQTVSSADVAEGCADATTGRTLLRFSLTSINVGDTDIYIGDPGCGTCSGQNPPPCTNPLFMCSVADGHGHGHLTGFADYLVYPEGVNEVVAAGHKEGFCLRDNICVSGVTPKYNCADQGITAGCSDLYSASLGCQYVDITKLEPGKYELHATVNDNAVLEETNYGNNRQDVAFEIPVPNLPDLQPVITDAKVQYGSFNIGSVGTCAEAVQYPKLNYRLQVNNIGPNNLALGVNGLAQSIAALKITPKGSTTVVVEAAKVESCIRDGACEAGHVQSFACTSQGLSSACGMTLSADGLCDGLSVAGLAPGAYTLSAQVDPEDAVKEVRNSNNLATADFEVCEALSDFKIVRRANAEGGGRDLVIRGRLSAESGDPVKQGLKFAFSQAGGLALSVSIPSIGTAGCKAKDRWIKEKGRRSWIYRNRSGYSDAACSVINSLVNQVRVRKTLQGFRYQIRIAHAAGSFVAFTPSLSELRAGDQFGRCGFGVSS